MSKIGKKNIVVPKGLHQDRGFKINYYWSQRNKKLTIKIKYLPQILTKVSLNQNQKKKKLIKKHPLCGELTEV